MSRESGLTLLELMIVLTIITILAGLAFLGPGLVQRDRLAEASRTLLADFHNARNNAMTRHSNANSWGFGIRFDSNRSYVVFEFIDLNGNYRYDDPVEELNPRGVTLSSPISITLNAATDPTGEVFIFDRRGILRNIDLSSATGRTYVLRSPNAAPRCLSVGMVRIREGGWSAATCVEM